MKTHVRNIATTHGKRNPNPTYEKINVKYSSRFSSYRAVNTILGYKNQSIYAANVTSIRSLRPSA
jgi:hypothetical protein